MNKVENLCADLRVEVLHASLIEELNVGDGRYRLAYDVRRKVCTLHQIGGQRREAPPARLLPRLPGWKLDWEHRKRTRRLR